MVSRLVLVVLLAACGSQVAPRPVTPPFALVCPAGFTPTGRDTVRGAEAWCVDLHGRRGGPYEWRYPDGSLAERGTFVADERDGDFETWYPGGARRSVGRYAHGRRDGWWKSWHVNGKIWLNGAYASGARVGPWTEYDHAGRTMFEGTFVADRIDGDWRTYDEGEPLSSGTVRDGKLEGRLSLVRLPWRVEKEYRANKAHGVWRWFKDDRLVSEVPYVDGVLHGRAVEYDESGAVKKVLRYEHGTYVEETGDAN